MTGGWNRTSIGLGRLTRREQVSGRRRIRLGHLPIALPIALVIIVMLNMGTYSRWHQRSDDAYSRAREYLLTHAPAGTGVIVVNGTSEFLLSDLYRVGPYTTDEQRRRYGVRYLLVPWREAYQNYTYVSLADVEELAGKGRLVWYYDGRTHGRVSLYELPSLGAGLPF